MLCVAVLSPLRCALGASCRCRLLGALFVCFRSVLVRARGPALRLGVFLLGFPAVACAGTPIPTITSLCNTNYTSNESIWTKHMEEARYLEVAKKVGGTLERGTQLSCPLNVNRKAKVLCPCRCNFTASKRYFLWASTNDSSHYSHAQRHAKRVFLPCQIRANQHRQAALVSLVEQVPSDCESSALPAGRVRTLSKTAADPFLHLQSEER